MQIFLVGGGVRDELLNMPVTDRDWVVVGSSPEEMLSLGFKQVGKDFPVFLHPQTNEQYALARVERKIAPGYYGFECVFSKKVTLVEDLQRRDLTINAIAKSQDGIIIDPFDGQLDLKNKILRNVSDAFIEDPVRVLRVARFLAKFSYLGFTVATSTMELMNRMVAAGELNNLVKERVWSEMVRALETKSPEQFFLLMSELSCLEIIGKNLSEVDFSHLQSVALQSPEVLVRFGALARGFSRSESFLKFASSLALPHEFKKFGLLCVSHKTIPHRASEVYELFKSLRIYHDGGLVLLQQFLQANELLEHKQDLLFAYERSLACNATLIQSKGFVGAQITAELDAARIILIRDSIYT